MLSYKENTVIVVKRKLKCFSRSPPEKGKAFLPVKLEYPLCFLQNIHQTSFLSLADKIILKVK